MIETGLQITDKPLKIKSTLPPTTLPTENSGLMTMPPSALIPFGQPVEKSAYAGKPKEKTLSAKDQELKTRADETIGKIVDLVAAGENNTSFISGANFPKAKLSVEGARALETVLTKCEPIDHDRGVAQDNDEFFTADPIEDSTKGLAAALKTQKQAIRARVRKQVTAEFKQTKRKIRGNSEFTAEVKRRLLEDREARQIVSKEAIYRQIAKARRDERIRAQRNWLLANDPSLSMPARESVSSSRETLGQTQKLIRETEQELRLLERQVKSEIIAEIKGDNLTRPRGQKVKIRDNPEIDTEMHKRMSTNSHVRELAQRGVAQIQLLQQIKAERRQIQKETTAVQFRATRMAQHQDAILAELGLRENYSYPQALEQEQLQNKQIILQEEQRWENLIRNSLAQRLNQRLTNDQIRDYGPQVRSDGSIQFSRHIENQLSELARKTARQFRRSGRILTGSLSKSELAQLRTQATTEIKQLIEREQVQALEARRAETELEVAIDLASSRHQESIRQRLAKFVRTVKRDPQVIKDLLLNIVKNRKVQLTAVSALNLAGIGINVATPHKPPESVVVSIPSNYWINEKLGELMDQQVQNIPKTNEDVSSDAVKLIAEKTDVARGLNEQDILRAEIRDERRNIIAGIPKSGYELPPVPPFIKAPPPSYINEDPATLGQLGPWAPFIKVIPNLQRDNVVGIADVDMSMMNAVKERTNTKVIRLAFSSQSFGSLLDKWDYAKANIREAHV